MKTRMKSLFVCLALVALAACGHGGVTGAAPGAGSGSGSGNPSPGVAGTGTGAGTYLVAGVVSGAPTGATTVTMSPASGVATTTNTDANGVYSFAMPAIGNYTITPNNPNYGFTPNQSSISITSATTGRAAINFAATSSYSISGTVSGSVNSGVNVILYSSGSGAPVSTRTDANGYYKFSGLPNGNYTVLASLPGYAFSPSNSVIPINGSSISGNNYTATANGSAPITNASISGTVSGAVTQGVTVKLYSTSSSTPQTTITDASGFFMFSGLSNGTYTVIPSLTGFSFNPSTTTATISGASITGTNYSSVAGTTVTTNNSLSGTVSGGIQQGVTIILHSPTGQVSAVTDATGYYQFTGLSNGTYTVIPTLSGYSFSPANTIVNISGASTAGTNFVATAGIVTTTNTLSGIISGEVIQGVTVNLYGSTTVTATSDVNGYYQFTGLNDGSYTVIPTMTGVAFTPGNLVVAVAGTTATGNDFSTVRTLHAISGTIPGLPGATVTLSGVASATTTTDSLGNYSFPGLANGNYMVTPSKAQYTFNPTSSSITLKSANSAGVNFTPTYIVVPTYMISGHITNRKGLAGNTISLSGTSAATTLTDSTGYYQFIGLVAGTYTITPSSAYPNVTYNPAATAITLNADAVANFNGYDTIDLTIAANQSNSDVQTMLKTAGWDGVTPIYSTITINSGVTLYATSYLHNGLDLKGVFPANSQISIVNNGTIMGSGGEGTTYTGSLGQYIVTAPTNGSAGLYISASSTNFITNNGVIEGGGGGSYGVGSYGAGKNGLISPGIGNSGGGAICGGGGSLYGGAFATNGTSGVFYIWDSFNSNCYQFPVTGGSGGPATVGAANATWNAIGTIIGMQN